MTHFITILNSQFQINNFKIPINSEKVDVILGYGECQHKSQAAARLYAERADRLIDITLFAIILFELNRLKGIAMIYPQDREIICEIEDFDG